ncbi:MAG: phosphate ABC transporter substrate-binding protein [Actinobacteria bacterium]|nr:phosphate ABC transporter substrate-binding protein [Actinomycetota bacterium]
MPPKDDIGLAGSDTIVGVMGTLGSQYQGKPDGVNTNGDTVSNVPPVLTGSQTYTIPADNKCPGVTYNSTTNQPPNGSSSGITALLNDTNGCLDIARSSRGRSPSDPGNIDFYAFAVDGVSWAGFTPGGHQPVNLTQSQLQGIYLCTNGGKPLFTDWSQVGGSAGAIIRYLPQTGSGTLSFFETKILGLSSAQQGVLDDTSCTSAPRPVRIEENSGNQVVSGFRPYAILPYSFADWNAQKNGLWPTGDIRAGSYLGAINGVGPAQNTIGESCGPCFLGRRYVYNVIKQGSPENANAINFAGVDSSHNGWICNNENDVKFIITAWGFVPLPVAPAGSGLPNSTCRKNPTPL